MEKSKNQRQPNPGRDKKAAKPDQHESVKQGKHERKREPAAAHPSDVDKSRAAVTGREQSGEGQQRMVTNQDEQRKATNTGNMGEVMGEEETEGDSGKQM